MISLRFVCGTFVIWEHGKESLKSFVAKAKMFHSILNFIAEYSKKEVNL